MLLCNTSTKITPRVFSKKRCHAKTWWMTLLIPAWWSRRVDLNVELLRGVRLQHCTQDTGRILNLKKKNHISKPEGKRVTDAAVGNQRRTLGKRSGRCEKSKDGTSSRFKQPPCVSSYSKRTLQVLPARVPLTMFFCCLTGAVTYVAG